MIGQKFQSLTVIALDDELNKQLRYERNKGLRTSAPIHYICKCDCGNVMSVAKSNLKKRKNIGCDKCALSYLEKYIGKTINKWFITALIKKNNKPYFSCICECGNEKDIYAYNILSNKSKDCGCGRLEYLYSQKIDLTGMKFGKLNVIRNTGEKRNDRDIYECLCDCGNYCYVRSNSLTTCHTTSCGCVNSNYNNIISDILDELEYDYETEYYINLKDYCNDIKFMRFDIFIESINLAIEYDGEFHFKPIPYLEIDKAIKELERTEYRDMIKDKYCYDNDIFILRIPYSEKKNIKNIIINTINVITCND